MFNLTIPLQGAKLAKWPKGQVTQWYGENAVLYSSLAGIKWHNGIDIAMPFRTPVLAAHDGTIYEVLDAPKGYGKHVRIISDKIEGIYFDTVYGHQDEIIVKEGQKVKAGDQIGYEGNSGFVVSAGTIVFWGNAPAGKGVHLHFGLRILTDTVDEHSNTSILGKNYVINDYNNGTHGAIDPMPYFNQPNPKTMIYSITPDGNQWLVDYSLKFAIPIADPSELPNLKGNPEMTDLLNKPYQPIANLDGYVIYRGGTDKFWKAFLNLK